MTMFMGIVSTFFSVVWLFSHHQSRDSSQQHYQNIFWTVGVKVKIQNFFFFKITVVDRLILNILNIWQKLHRWRLAIFRVTSLSLRASSLIGLRELQNLNVWFTNWPLFPTICYSYEKIDKKLRSFSNRLILKSYNKYYASIVKIKLFAALCKCLERRIKEKEEKSCRLLSF